MESHPPLSLFIFLFLIVFFPFKFILLLFLTIQCHVVLTPQYTLLMGKSNISSILFKLYEGLHKKKKKKVTVIIIIFLTLHVKTKPRINISGASSNNIFDLMI